MSVNYKLQAPKYKQISNPNFQWPKPTFRAREDIVIWGRRSGSGMRFYISNVKQIIFDLRHPKSEGSRAVQWFP